VLDIEWDEASPPCTLTAAYLDAVGMLLVIDFEAGPPIPKTPNTGFAALAIILHLSPPNEGAWHIIGFIANR
jgi:hypothetical protein